MPTTKKRPWDKEWHHYNRDQKELESDDEEEETEDHEVPYIDIDGSRFYSDRFYLHRTSTDPPASAPASSNSQAFDLYNQDCCCGARKPPPLLDREQLINSLDLKAAIIATYTVDLTYMMTAFPKLCGPNATVPTLVLHGLKGLSSEKKLLDNSNNDDDNDNDDSSVDEEYRQRHTTTPSAAEHDDDDDENNEMDPEETARQNCIRAIRSGNLGSSFHFTQVRPKYVPIEHQHSSSDGSWKTVKPDIKQQLKNKMGVHHPKYMILFEKDGSVIVLVSTGNFSRPSATDASWVQRFEPAVGKEESSNSNNPPAAKIPKTTTTRSDFGSVLVNFLQCQSYATAGTGMIPEEFLNEYMKVSSLNDLRRNYRFDRAEVFLIATVPGEYNGRAKTKHNGKFDKSGSIRTFLYGRQRVADIVAKLCLSGSNADAKHPGENRPWFPKSLLSDQDRLILQPTSIGANVQRGDLSDVARSYLGLDDIPTSTSSSQKSSRYDEENILKRVDIVWPAQKLINRIIECDRNNLKRTKSPTSVAGITIDTGDGSTNPSIKQERPGEATPFLFLASKTFNSLPDAFLSRMMMFEPSIPEQRTPRSPHFKSVARLFEGNTAKLRKDFQIQNAEERFSWFLLTSACLSHGAQGKMTEEFREKKTPAKGGPTLTYSNFELGVMFYSRLQGLEGTDRLYCWKPSQCHCSCGSDSSQARMIHLPIPYCCRATSYQIDSDEPDFVETPYFHEIEPGLAVGNMRHTPYGATVAEALNHAAEEE